MVTLKNISENYRIRCKELGLSEADVARRSEMPLEIVRNIASGVETRIMPIYWVGQALEMTIDELVSPPRKG